MAVGAIAAKPLPLPPDMMGLIGVIPAFAALTRREAATRWQPWSDAITAPLLPPLSNPATA